MTEFTFLEDQPGRRPWDIPEGLREDITALGYYLGQGSPSLEVAAAEATDRPQATAVRNLWKRRQNKRPSSLLTLPGLRNEGFLPPMNSGRE